MAKRLIYDLNRIKHPRDKRLAREHMSIHEFCSKTERISYKVVKDHRRLPVAYHVEYKLRTIVGLNPDNTPIFGYTHTAEITLPQRYPLEPAKLYMISDVWHPNIKSTGTYKGRICGNTKEFGSLYELGMLVQRIGEILQYKNYHAINVSPYPEDEKVAKWVRDYAEPNDVVNRDKGISTDSTSIMSPLSEAPQASSEDAIVLKVEEETTQDAVNPTMSTEKVEYIPPPEPKKERRRISIKRLTLSEEPKKRKSIKINRRD